MIEVYETDMKTNLVLIIRLDICFIKYRLKFLDIFRFSTYQASNYTTSVRNNKYLEKVSNIYPVSQLRQDVIQIRFYVGAPLHTHTHMYAYGKKLPSPCDYCQTGVDITPTPPPFLSEMRKVLT